MRTVALAAVLAIAALPTAASADQVVKGECLIAVGGKTYRDGPCNIRLYPGGGFQAGGGRGGEYFATVDIDAVEGGATAFWNGVEAESKAHETLGAVARQGGCWTNRKARICAWRAGTRPRNP